ncbi:PEP-CTERM sorting domain-containing protein [Lentisalinibacter salinarum]|uniref:PEP-CTERM sorting domain-containing protein n=1 Tax=Lentisalinibacter salinarum TaxID=2992239 RepID=UPI0038659DFF
MKLLRKLVPITLAIAAVSVAEADPILLHENQYIQSIGFSGEDPFFRHFYGVTANSPPWNTSSQDLIVASFETTTLSNGFSGGFVFDATTDQDWFAFASRITDSVDQLSSEGLRLYVGIANATNAKNVAGIGSSETSLGILDSLLPGSSLDFVRIDVNEWILTDPGVYRYNINISYWGTPSTVPEPGTLALFGIGLAAMGFSSPRKKVRIE